MALLRKQKREKIANDILKSVVDDLRAVLADKDGYIYYDREFSDIYAQEALIVGVLTSIDRKIDDQEKKLPGGTTLGIRRDLMIVSAFWALITGYEDAVYGCLGGEVVDILLDAHKDFMVIQQAKGISDMVSRRKKELDAGRVKG